MGFVKARIPDPSGGAGRTYVDLFPESVVYMSVEENHRAETPSQPLENGRRIVDTRVVQPVSVTVNFTVRREDGAAVLQSIRTLFRKTPGDLFRIFTPFTQYENMLFDDFSGTDDEENYDVKTYTATFKEALLLSSLQAGMFTTVPDLVSHP